MLLSFFSLFLIYNFIFFKNKKINFFQEDIYLFIYLIIVVVFFTLFTKFDKNFADLFFSITSSISNIGISKTSLNNNYSFLFLILVIIGGSLFSTSSGLRFLKLYTLLKFSINELISHVKPREINIIKLKFSDYFYDSKEINKIFITLILFIISFLFLGSILTLTGVEFVYSFKLSILTLMNTTTSNIYGMGDFIFFDLAAITKYFLIIFMILGRIELLALLLVLKKIFFKN
jgi:trk system potassium uptake protein TrkH